MSEETTTVETATDEDEELLDQFEERYQTEQVLNDSAGVEATVEHAGWRDGANEKYVGAVCLHLSIPGGSEYPVVVTSLVSESQGGDVLSLFRWLGISPGQDLSALDGESVAIDIASTDEAEFVRLDTGDGLLHGQIVDDERLVRNAPQTLPEDVVAGMKRLDSYQRVDDAAPSVRIAGLGATEEKLLLEFEGEWGTAGVPVERAYEPTPQTPYETLVERVGGGSVKQIAGGSVHLVHASNMPMTFGTPFADLTEDEREQDFDGYVTTTTDLAGEWAVLLDEPDAGVADAFGFVWMTALLLSTCFMLFGAVTGTYLVGLLGLVGLLCCLAPTFIDRSDQA